jgi:hypothetical protein
MARPTAGLVRAVAAATMVAQVPHFMYHATHLDVLLTALDRTLQTGALALLLVVPIVVLVSAGEIGRERRASSRQTASIDANVDGRPPRLVASTR